MTFDWMDFLAPLDPAVLAMSLILGLSMGTAIRVADHRVTVQHAFWMLAGGTVFFVPLSILRASQGSAIWERLLATGILWAIYVLGMLAASVWRRDD